MKTKHYFQYGAAETEFLSSRDPRLGDVIARIGRIDREVIPDMFAALVHAIVGQQISTKAHQTIWQRMTEKLGEVSPQAIDTLAEEELQRFGLTFRKCRFIREIARKVLSRELDIDSLKHMSDEDVCASLVKLDGIGVWSAEMLMLFSMQRPDIFSFGDLAIHRGLRMVYHHRRIDRKLLEKYRRRFSPCCSVASLYLWAVAAGAIGEMKDHAPRKTTKGNSRRKR